MCVLRRLATISGIEVALKGPTFSQISRNFEEGFDILVKEMVVREHGLGD